MDHALPISSFADHYAQTHGYAPSAVLRMVFLLAKKEDEDEDEDEDENENTFWSPDIRQEGISVGERIQDGDVLHLIIRPLEDPDWSDRLSILRRLLTKEGLHDLISDETLFSLYSVWVLTWIPPAKSNRYLRMKAFVEAHPDVFHLMNEEEKAMSARRKVLLQFHEWAQAFEKSRRDSWEYIDLNSRGVNATHHSSYYLLRVFIDSLPYGTVPNRELLRDRSRQHIAYLASHCDPTMDRIHIYTVHRLLSLWTVPELKEMGLTENSVPDAWRTWFAEWDTLSQEWNALASQ